MSTLSGTILVADDDVDIRDILSETLSSLGSRVIAAANGQECLDKVDREAPELVLLDIEMPVKNGLEVLKELRQRGRDTTAIMITAYGTIERAVQVMREGAFDFITKPFDLDHVALTVEKALERERLKRGLERFTEEAGQRYRLIGGESPKMKLAIETARKAAPSKSTVLLLGESGTGKEVFAGLSTTGAREDRIPLSPSIVWASPRISSKASFSVMKRARSREPISSKRARWN
jgi:DNA-binding NtrC family response regulator